MIVACTNIIVHFKVFIIEYWKMCFLLCIFPHCKIHFYIVNPQINLKYYTCEFVVWCVWCYKFVWMKTFNQILFSLWNCLMLKEMLHLNYFFCGTKQWTMEHYFNAF